MVLHPVRFLVVLVGLLAASKPVAIVETGRVAGHEHGVTPEKGHANKPYLSVSEAAELGRVAPSTIRLYIRKGQLKRQKVGRRVIVSRAELERFLGSQSSKVVELYPT